MRLSVLAATALTASLAATSVAVAAPKAGGGEVMGYAITWFQPAFYFSDADCPNGLNEEMDWKAIFQKRGMPAAKITELLEHPNDKAFMREIVHRGKNGENVCAVPTADFASPTWKTGVGKVSYGGNLDGTGDGAATATTCKHEKYAGADGTPGVDNQLFRVLACSKGHRGEGHSAFILNYINERMREGMMTYLMEVTGVDDAKNDPDVTVTIYKGADPLKQDAAGGVLADSTLRVANGARWATSVKGRIKDGVITTENFDMDLLADALWLPEFHFKQARLNLTIGEDRQVKGTLVGYQDWQSIYWGLSKTGYNFEKYSGGNCPGIYNAFKALADGGKDPVTGECSLVSTAYAVEAVPAFLIHPDDSKTADAKPLRTTDAR